MSKNIVLTILSLAFCAVSVPAVAHTCVPLKAHKRVPVMAHTPPKLSKPTPVETMNQYAPSCVNNEYSSTCKAV